MRIDLGIPHLRAVVAVADARNFTAAAAELHVAQSSLSRTVAEAERRLRVRLFDRSPRGVEMTTEGREVVALARHLLGEYDAGLRHVTGYLEGTRGTLTLAALPAVAATLLPRLLAAYRSTRPDVTVQVLDMLSEENLQRVRDGTVDLAVTSAPPPDRELVVQPMVDDCFFVAVSPEHRLAERERLTWSDLDGESFLAFSLSSTSVRGAVDRVLAEAGVGVGRVLEARTVGAVAGLTAAGLGVSVVPGLVLPMIEFAGLRHILLEPIVRRRICLVRHRRRPTTPAVLAFLDTVRSAADGAGPLPRGTEWRFEPGGPG